MSDRNAKSSAPFVSVVIPAHNEAIFITDCIASVTNSGPPLEHVEILVVDHRSSDSTEELALLAGASVLHLNAGKIGTVRNTGLRAARGEFVAYVDADCLVPATWLRSAIGILESDATIGAVGGPCLSPVTGTWVERALAPSYVRPGIVKPAKTLATSSFIARRSLLNEVGQFDETLISGEDDDISNRIRQRGLRLAWASDCHIIHRGYPRKLWGVVKKETWHGSNHIEVRSGTDLTLILTVIFLLATAGFLISLPVAMITATTTSLGALTLNLLVQSAPPCLFALKRLKQSPRDWHLTLSVVLVGYAYFLGHGIGIVANYWRRVFSGRIDQT